MLIKQNKGAVAAQNQLLQCIGQALAVSGIGVPEFLCFDFLVHFQKPIVFNTEFSHYFRNRGGETYVSFLDRIQTTEAIALGLILIKKKKSCKIKIIRIKLWCCRL